MVAIKITMPIFTVRILRLRFPIEGYLYNAQILSSNDKGKSWRYCGNGMYFRSYQEALNWKGEHNFDTYLQA